MAELLVKQVMTEDGLAQIDYNALANKPTIPMVDETLNANSTNAIQNKAVSTAINGINNSIKGINTSLNEVLGEDGKVANSSDSEKLGGQEPSYYATAQSVTDLGQSLGDSKAPNDHASSEVTYGVGTNEKYGHVKLSDATDSELSYDGGIAATPNAVKAAYDLANAAMPKANFMFDTATQTLYITNVTEYDSSVTEPESGAE